MLLKKKGTTVGIQNLITTYGIPSTILRVAEFGGKDKDESNDWDYYKQRYNYGLGTGNNPSIATEWSLNSIWGSTDDVPNTLQFRFKLPSSGSTGAVNYAVSNNDTVLWSLDDSSNVAIVLEYTGSGFTSGSYSGSIVNPFYQYGNLRFTADGLTTTASVYLPFFNGDWWSVMVSRVGSSNFTLYAANNIYNGDDGSSIGFIASSSYIDGDSGTNWITPGINSYFGANGDGITLGGNTYTTVSGSYQEIRYYTVGLSSSAFIDWTMNPDSIEGNYLNSAPNQLAFRASLGGELYTGSVSIHPKVTGSWVATSSFAPNSDFTLNAGITFNPNVETVYLDQPAAGIKNIVSNKIQIVDMNLPSGSTLSQYRSIQQQPPGGSTYTENLAYTEVAFSPQNEINDDIMDQLGFFNMGEFIGDPRQRFTEAESYPDLDALRNAYFEKYISNYDLNDYVRLIKFFDNSLFKMIKDFTPARASLASGVVVKQHLLERNKYPQPEIGWALYDYSGSIDMGTIEGGAGGSVNNLNSLNTNPYYVNNVYGVTQSWQENIIIPSGIVTQTHDSQDEFYNGEFSGSEFVVENGELNEANPVKQVETTLVNYQVTGSNNTNPGSGVIYWNVGVPGGGPPFGTQYVDELYINEIDTTGLSIQEALSNLTPGGTITFPVQYQLDPIVPGIPVIVNKTITGVITNVSPIGNTIWRVRLAYSTGTNGTDVTYDPLNDNFVFDNTSGNVISNPFLNNIPRFYNSDYNAIINNADINRFSQWYKQIDYATAQTVPVNFQQIISGTAYPAEVQDSNYTSYQYSGIRYIGSKNTTDDFNNSSITDTAIIESQQNVDLGATTFGLPSVDLNRIYFSYFNWAGGTAPDWGNVNEDKTVYSIRFFIDQDGNIVRPLNSPDGIALGIMNQNFTEGENAVSSLLNTNISSYAVSILNGTYPIFKSGKVIQPILYSQTQSISGGTTAYGYTSSILFDVQLGTTQVPNYGFQAYKTATQTSNNISLNTTNNIALTFPNEAYDYQGDYSTGTSIYTFGDDSEAGISFKAFIRHDVDFIWEDPYITPGQQLTVTLAIQLSEDSGVTFTDLAVKNVPFAINTGIKETTFANPSRFFNSGDQVRVVMKTYNVSPNPFNERANMSFYANSYFNNSQTQGGFTTPTASGGYWTTGSTPSNILTASVQLTNLYGYRQTDITSSGFNTINYPFEVQPYDEIRFEATEENTYVITSVEYTDRVYLYLDRDINPPSTDINFFLIRRYVDDPAYLILNVNKPAGASGGGIIKPEFLSGETNLKINQVIENLEERGLLPTQ